MLKKDLSVLVMILNLFVLTAMTFSPHLATDSNAIPLSVQVDDFEFTTTDGQIINLYSYLGKPVVIDWAASWCSVCKANQRSMNDIYPYYKNNVHFLSISFGGSGDDLEDMKKMKADGNYPWTFGLDTNNKAAEFGTRNGYVWILNADMTLAKEWAYAIVSPSQLQEQLNSILPENQRVGAELGGSGNNPVASSLLENPLFLGFAGVTILLVGVVAFLRVRPRTQTPTESLAIESANKTEQRLKQLQDALNRESSSQSTDDAVKKHELQPRNKRHG